MLRACKHSKQSTSPQRNFYAFGTIGLWLIFLSLPSNAQWINTVFYDSIRSTSEPGLYVDLRGSGFFRNTEYFNDLVKGSTLFGYHALPTLSLVPSERFTLQAGLFARQDFGDFARTDVKPLLSLKYSHKGFTLIFGTLEGALRHELAEPLYDFEQWINRRQEQGVQIQYWKPNRLKIDAWIDWQQATYPFASQREAFWAGTTGFLRLSDGDQWYINLPWQATAYHIGGQVDTSSASTITQLTAGLGLRLGRKLGNEKQLYAEYLYFGHSNSGNFDFIKNSTGDAHLMSFVFQRKGLQIHLNHWIAWQFYNFQGGPIYRSFSVINAEPKFNAAYRNMTWLRAGYDFILSDELVCTLRAEAYYDPSINIEGQRKSTVEYGYGLYLNYRIAYKLMDVPRR